MKKMTLAEKIIAIFKGSDESKLNRFELKLNKYLAKQISQREDEIENLKEKLEDAQELLKDSIVGVTLESIMTTEKTEAYIVEYIENLLDKKAIISVLKDKIDSIKEDVKLLKELLVDIDSVEIKIEKENSK